MEPGTPTRVFSPRFVLTVAGAGLALALDAVTPLGLAAWLLQVGLVWSATFWAGARQMVAIAALCSSFIVLGFWFSPKTGIVLWVEVSNLLLGLGATWAITHISLRHRAAEQARRLAEEAALQARTARRHLEMKSLLLDALAHELQTPLTSIRAGAAALRGELAGAAQLEWLEIIDQESARLGFIVLDALQVARIEEGPVDLDLQTHTVDGLLHATLPRPMAEPALLETDLPPGLPPVSCDAGLVRLALRQVVANAVRSSQPGAPVLLCARAAGGQVVVSVTDRGPGMSREEQARAFDKYYRGPRGPAQPAGVGMALPIARAVVEAHGGRIWIESRVGQGATVSFTLPRAQDL